MIVHSCPPLQNIQNLSMIPTQPLSLLHNGLVDLSKCLLSVNIFDLKTCLGSIIVQQNASKVGIE